MRSKCPSLRQAERLVAVAGLDAGQPFERQVERDQFADVRLVFDDERAARQLMACVRDPWVSSRGVIVDRPPARDDHGSGAPQFLHSARHAPATPVLSNHAAESTLERGSAATKREAARSGRRRYDWNRPEPRGAPRCDRCARRRTARLDAASSGAWRSARWRPPSWHCRSRRGCGPTRRGRRQAPPCVIRGSATAGQVRLPGVGITVDAEGRRRRDLDLDGPGRLVLGRGPGPGTYTIAADLTGFAPVTLDVVVDASCQAQQNIALTLASRVEAAEAGRAGGCSRGAGSSRRGAARPADRRQAPAPFRGTVGAPAGAPGSRVRGPAQGCRPVSRPA